MVGRRHVDVAGFEVGVDDRFLMSVSEPRAHAVYDFPSHVFR